MPIEVGLVTSTYENFGEFGRDNCFFVNLALDDLVDVCVCEVLSIHLQD